VNSDFKWRERRKEEKKETVEELIKKEKQEEKAEKRDRDMSVGLDKVERQRKSKMRRD
jgi:hypothetical protein